MRTILRSPEHIKAILTRYYTGTATVEIKESVYDESTHKTRPQVTTLFENIQCRLSHESKTLTSAYERNLVDQTIMLFLDNIYDIPAGAKITVVQDGVENCYGLASEPNVFETHQQIELKLWEDWSGTKSKRRSQDVQGD